MSDSFPLVNLPSSREIFVKSNSRQAQLYERLKNGPIPSAEIVQTPGTQHLIYQLNATLKKFGLKIVNSHLGLQLFPIAEKVQRTRSKPKRTTPKPGTMCEKLFNMFKGGAFLSIEELTKEFHPQLIQGTLEYMNATLRMRAMLFSVKKYLAMENLFLTNVEGKYKILEKEETSREADRRHTISSGPLKSFNEFLIGSLQAFQDDEEIANHLEGLMLATQELHMQYRKRILNLKKNATTALPSAVDSSGENQARPIATTPDA